MRAIAVVLLVALVGAGCASPGEVDDNPPSSSSTAANTPTTTPVVTVDPPLPEVALDAIADLSVRLGIAASEIVVESFEEVTWSDGSIGCPEEGVLYTQALEDGALVILEHDGEQYSYHQKQLDDPFLCDRPGGDKYIMPRAEP